MAVYVYAPEADDLDCMGLCGALMPTRCEHEEQAGGMSELVIEHPYDRHGRWQALVTGNIVKAPVPVRTTPAIEGTRVVTNLQKGTVKATATKNERYLHTKSKSGAKGDKKKKLLPANLAVTVVKAEDERYSVRAGKYGSGWIDKNAITINEQVTTPSDTGAIEAVEPAWSVRDQLFRIYDYDRQDDKVTAKARHITFDLLGNLTVFKDETSITAQAALDGIMDNTAMEHDFEAYTDVGEARLGVAWERVNPIKALQDPEEGLLKRWGLELVRDDYEMYFLKRAGLNRGVRIEYGKNLTGISSSVSWDEIVTVILPVGEDKDGNAVYLTSDPAKVSKEITDASYVRSPRADYYPTPHVVELKVDDAKIDSKKGGADVTPAIAARRMREAAEQQFKDGCDMPRINIEVDFVQLGGTVEYARFAQLEDVYLYDTVTVKHKQIGVEVALDVVRVVYDCLRGRYSKVELGTLRDMMLSTIATWQLPSGINGSLIAPGTLTGGHLAADSISANHIQAGSIAADHINANTLVAATIIAGICDIIQANILKADIGEAHIDWAQIVDLKATFAKLALAEIDTANISWAHIVDMVTGTAIINEGVGGKLFISRLAVTEANMVSLTVGELIVKGDDGRFYAMSVDADGNVVTTLKEIDGDDIADRAIDAGTKIIEHSITASELNVTQIFADQALVRAIKAANLDVDDLFANTAWINNLSALMVSTNVIRALEEKLDLSANESIRLIAGDTALPELAILLSNGQALGSAITSTTAKARVTKAGLDITSQIPDNAFNWTRKSKDTSGDAAWNAQASHKGVKQITISSPADVLGDATFELTTFGGEDMYGTIVFDFATMTLIHQTPPGYVGQEFALAGGVLTAQTPGYRLLSDGTLVYDNDVGTEPLSASVTILAHTGTNYSQATAPTGLKASDQGAIWYDTGTGVTYRWSGTAWVEVIAQKVSASAVQIDPENGLVVTQYLSNQTQIPTYFKANSRQFGLYDPAGQAIAEGGIENGKGYFAATSLRNPNTSDARIDLIREISANVTYNGLRMMINDNEVGKLIASYISAATKSLTLDSCGGAMSLRSTRTGQATFSSVEVDVQGSQGSVLLQSTMHGGGQFEMLELSGLANRIYATHALTVNSDQTLKQDIEDVQTDLVDLLTPRQFRWKNNPERLNYGFIAQEVAEAIEACDLPELELIGKGRDGKMVMSYEQIIALLVDKTRRQDRRMCAIEKRIEALERRA